MDLPFTLKDFIGRKVIIVQRKEESLQVAELLRWHDGTLPPTFRDENGKEFFTSDPFVDYNDQVFEALSAMPYIEQLEYVFVTLKIFELCQQEHERQLYSGKTLSEVVVDLVVILDLLSRAFLRVPGWIRYCFGADLRAEEVEKLKFDTLKPGE